jgi:hypothetical protein
LLITDREFGKRLHEKRPEAIRAEVLAEKKKPPTREKPAPNDRRKKT